MKIKSNKDISLTSTAGTVVFCPAGKEVNVAPMFAEAAARAGCSILSDPPPPPAMSPEERLAKVKEAVQEILVEGNKKHFVKAGVVKVDVVSTKVGFESNRKEVNEVTAGLLSGQSE